MRDYTIDKRGDIGSIVREASMNAIVNLLNVIIDHNSQEGVKPYVIDEKLIFDLICSLLQQLVEKIDRIRLIAGSLLQNFSDNLADKLPDFPHKSSICSLFSKSNVKRLIDLEEEVIKKTYQEQFENAAYDTTSADLREKGDNYIYYWNQPHCVFPLIVPLMIHKELTYPIVNKY